MELSQQVYIILGMAVVTAIPRIAPLLFLSSRPLPEPFMRWLEMIPPAVLAALLAQEIVLINKDGHAVLNLGLDNLFLLAVLPTVVVGWFSRNFFATVTAGLISVALLRQVAL